MTAEVFTAIGLTLLVLVLDAVHPAPEPEIIQPEIREPVCRTYAEAQQEHGPLALQYMILTGGCE